MTGLQEAFYIMGIVFMSLIFLLTLALVVAVFVIRAKINRIHDIVDEKVGQVTRLAEKGGELSALAGSVVARRAKKAVRKVKK
jgi:hypothetical protein